MKDWREYYQSRFISAEDAAKLVKSGDRVVFTFGREALAVGLAIAARKDELRDVQVFAQTPGYDFGWYDPGWEDSFKLTVSMATATAEEMIHARRCDVSTGWIFPIHEVEDADVVLTEISSPDDKGFCSFGNSVWNKKSQIGKGRLRIAEVNERLIRTYGENFIHVTELDYFVEHKHTGKETGAGSLAGRAIKEEQTYVKSIAEYIKEIIKDRDTIQIGAGRTTEPLVNAGMLDGKQDLGYHAEATPPGIIRLVREGVITGKYKTLNPGKVVVTSVGGGSREEMEWVDGNPLFYLMEVDYIEDVRVISNHDNFVAINECLIMDLTGQIGASGLGTTIYAAAAGGQLAFAYGALFSKGGRSITVLHSTARGGSISRIVPLLPQGTPVTVPREAADIIVSEHGVAKLRGKTLRQRAEEMISIAHPNFQTELRKEAQKFLYP